jgi:hypothetical protein
LWKSGWLENAFDDTVPEKKKISFVLLETTHVLRRATRDLLLSASNTIESLPCTKKRNFFDDQLRLRAQPFLSRETEHRWEEVREHFVEFRICVDTCANLCDGVRYEEQTQRRTLVSLAVFCSVERLPYYCTTFFTFTDARSGRSTKQIVRTHRIERGLVVTTFLVASFFTFCSL